MLLDGVDLILHLDLYLAKLVASYGLWMYLILWVIIFAETGLVVTPFLPGDSLLFAVGALSADPAMGLNAHLFFILLSIAAIVGNLTNYRIGYWVGPEILKKKDIRFIRKEYLERTHAFYEKYGGKTIVLARFLPIIRTFAPFIAGIGFMNHKKFVLYSVTAGILWVATFIYLGNFFGNLPFVKEHFSYLIFAIIFISMIPAVIEFFKKRS